jgi:ABC-type proline/glycine betaine transport system ATPase subunit
MLSLQEVTKIYPGAEHIKAVDGLSFDLEEGEICTMVGPSGCGKTTAMKMVNRLIPITSGKILIDGQNIYWLRDPKYWFISQYDYWREYCHNTETEGLGSRPDC